MKSIGEFKTMGLSVAGRSSSHAASKHLGPEGFVDGCFVKLTKYATSRWCAGEESTGEVVETGAYVVGKIILRGEVRVGEMGAVGDGSREGHFCAGRGDRYWVRHCDRKLAHCHQLFDRKEHWVGVGLRGRRPKGRRFCEAVR